jgi:hypothetical protein
MSCNITGNQIYNGDFELLGSDGTNVGPTGWGFVASDFSLVSLTVQTAPAPGANQFARLTFSSSEAVAQLSQPLTLCPGVTYALTTWTRQSDVVDMCMLAVNVGSVEMGVVQPTAAWTDGLSSRANFTAGPDVEDASVELVITVSCAGRAGESVDRVIDLDGFGLVVT